MFLTCLLYVGLGAPCHLQMYEHPGLYQVDVPHEFIFGKSTNRTDSRFMNKLEPYIPHLVAYVPQPRPKPPEIVIDSDIIVTAYAPPGPGIGKLIKNFGKLPVHAVHRRVNLSCIHKDKRLVKALGKIHRRFGKRILVTSAYRSRTYNKRVRGARKSMHIRCRALDIKIPGVSKYELRRYVRALPEIGGVGIYNGSYIHIDTGRKRNWDWRGRKKRRRK